MERDRFIASVTVALRSSRIPDEPAPSRPSATKVPADLVGLFSDRARVAGAVVHGPIDRHRVAGLVTTIASDHQTSGFVAWDDLPASGVLASLAAAGLERVDCDLPVGPERFAHLARLGKVGVGVTGAMAGLADSGSVVLAHGPGRPRLASLAPDIHIVLLEAGAIVPSLAHWAGQGPQPVRGTANLVVITGPSRSADIELELNLGVHGPRHVEVVLIG